MLIRGIALLLVVRIYGGHVDSASRELDAAEAVATDILRRAAVDTRWVRCGGKAQDEAGGATHDPRCSEPPGPAELTMRIASFGFLAEPTTRFRLGFAYVDTGAGRGTVATVYRGPVAQLAAAAKIDVATLLGRAIAHEIGHLLLGTNEHRPDGLMRATWTPLLLQRRAAAYWRFSREDTDALVANLRQRLGGN